MTRFVVSVGVRLGYYGGATGSYRGFEHIKEKWRSSEHLVKEFVKDRALARAGTAQAYVESVFHTSVQGFQQYTANDLSRLKHMLRVGGGAFKYADNVVYAYESGYFDRRVDVARVERFARGHVAMGPRFLEESLIPAIIDLLYGRTSRLATINMLSGTVEVRVDLHGATWEDVRPHLPVVDAHRGFSKPSFISWANEGFVLAASAWDAMLANALTQDGFVDKLRAINEGFSLRPFKRDGLVDAEVAFVDPTSGIGCGYTREDRSVSCLAICIGVDEDCGPLYAYRSVGGGDRVSTP